MISDNNNCKLCGSQGRPGVNRKITAPAPPPLSSDSQARLPPSSREVSELELSSAPLSLLTLVEGEWREAERQPDGIAAGSAPPLCLSVPASSQQILEMFPGWVK